MKLLPSEKNWVSQVAELRHKYGLINTDNEIARLDKKKYKMIIDVKVKEYAFET